MGRLYYDKDADLADLDGRCVAVVGYGIQGRAQALNLHDSGVNVVVGVRPNGESAKAAEKDGLDTASVAAAVQRAEVTMVLIPDEVQPEVYAREIGPNLRRGGGRWSSPTGSTFATERSTLRRTQT